MECPSCNTNNHGNRKSCSNCGLTLENLVPAIHCPTCDGLARVSGVRVDDLEFVTACDIFNSDSVHPYKSLSKVGWRAHNLLYYWSCGQLGLQANNRYTTATGDKWLDVLCKEVMSPKIKAKFRNDEYGHREWFQGCYALID